MTTSLAPALSGVGAKLLLTAAVTSHIPFLGWLVVGDNPAPFGDLRSIAALFALTLLVWLRRPRLPEGRTMGREAAGCLGSAIALALVALAVPVLWVGSLLLLASGLVMWSAPEVRGSSRLQSYGVLILLTGTIYPFERDLGLGLDPLLQTLTAHFAAPLVNVTGLAVEVTSGAGDPVLVGTDLFVTVTALCAGSQTLLSLWTLGLIIAEVFLDRWDTRLIFVALTPLFGFIGNVMRVAVSTHAAQSWGNRAQTWDIAHDVIGYGAFAGTYLLLILAVRMLRGTGGRRNR